MPYITAATHGINTFYEDALKKTRNGRVILYAKKSSDASTDVHTADMSKAFTEVANNPSFTNNFYPIAVTSLVDPVSIQTSLRWEQGGNIVDAFKLGIKSGMNSVTNAAAELIKNAATAYNTVFKPEASDANVTQRQVNMLMRKYRRKVISASSAYKNYGGSDTSINLPTLEFVYSASDFCGKHMQRAYNLLSYLLPVNTIQSNKSLNSNADNQKMGVNSGVSDSVLDSTYWMYETPPNNYVNPAMGFNSSFIEGTFALDVSGTVVKDLIPTSVMLVQSRARVLSIADYASTKKHCMDDFYSATELLHIKGGLGATIQKSVLPVVVKIIVQFDFAKHITIYDWQQMFFKHEGLTVQGNATRHDSDISFFNQGAESNLSTKVDASDL